MGAINIVLDDSPGEPGGRFVEVETDDGRSLALGEWTRRTDGFWALRITALPDDDESTPGREPTPGTRRVVITTSCHADVTETWTYEVPRGWQPPGEEDLPDVLDQLTALAGARLLGCEDRLGDEQDRVVLSCEVMAAGNGT